MLNTYSHQLATNSIMTQNGNYSVNRLLREHPDRLALLENSFNFDKNLIHKDFYQWSRVRSTKRELKPEILKLVVYLLYPLQTLERKREIYLISYYLLITKKFKKDFKILTKEIKDVYGIQNLFNYILNGRALKDLDVIPENNFFECYICLEQKQGDFAECENHHPDSLLCGGCYSSLSPKRCPICRHNTINFQTFDLPDTREISFKFNHHKFTQIYELDDGFTLFYCDGLDGITSLKISIHTFGSIALKEVIEYLADCDGEDAPELFDCLPPANRYLFPTVEILASFIDSIADNNPEQILPLLLELNTPEKAFKFYHSNLRITEIADCAPDHQSLFMEKITMGYNFDGMVFNSPEGAYFLQHCDDKNARFNIHPFHYGKDFLEIDI